MADTTDTVPLWDPKRSDIVDVPHNVADNLVRTGYHYKTGDDALREQTDQGSVGAAASFAHSAVNSLGFGLPDVALANVPSFLGGDYIADGLKRVHKMEEDHPNYATAGDIAGYLGPGGVAHLLGKGAQKFGAHALLKAAAEYTPQHLAEKLGADVAAKYTLGKTATRLAKKAGSAVGFGVEQGVRGAAKADVDEQMYDTAYDVEKVYQAFGHDALTGFGTDGLFGIAGEGLRGLRKGASRITDKLEQVYPSKVAKDGRVQGPDILEPKVYLKRTQDVAEKTKTTTKTGGGWEKGETHAKRKESESTFEETKAKAENEIDDRYDTQTGTKSKPKPSHKVEYKENIYEDEKPKDENLSGFEWGKDSKPHEIIAAIRTQMDDLVGKDATDLEMSRLVMEHEADYKQAMSEERTGDAYRLKKNKDEMQTYLKDKYKDYGPLLEEYGKVQRGEHVHFDPEKEIVETPRKKVGVKTTTEISGQEPEVTTKEKTKNDNYHYDSDQTTTRKKTAKEALDEERTKFHHNLDSEHEVKETTVRNHKYEPITVMKPKKSYVQQYKTVYESKIPWQVKGLGTYGAHQAGVGGVVWPLIAGDIAIPHILNNRLKYSAMLDKYTQKPAEQMGRLLRNITSSKINSDYSQGGKLSRHLRNPDKLYAKVVQHLQAQANDPGATQQQIQHNIGFALQDHPHLQTGLILKTQQVAQVAKSLIPPDTRPPTAQHTPHNPPRSQKVKFLRLFHAMNQPLDAMNNPTPQMIQVIEQTNPETLALLRRSLLGYISENKKPLNGKTAQVASMILGQEINPRNSAAYLKRLQETAALDAPQTEPSGGNMHGPHAGSIAGPKSAKVQQDAMALYATPQQLHEIA